MAKRRASGEGTIYQNPQGYWVAQITLPNGKRRTVSRKTQKEVKDWLLKQREAVRTGSVSESDKVTVSEFLTQYMETAKHRLRPKTISSYKYLIDSHITPIIGHIKLSRLQPAHLQKLYNLKLESGLSRRTVQYIHSVVHKALDQALKWGLVFRNVSDMVDAPKPKKKTPITWNEKQAQKFLEAVKDSRFYPLYVLAITTGMRQGELLGIHWQDVDLERGVLHVRHAVQDIRGKGVTITEPKTDKSKRSIKLPDIAIEALRELDKKSEGLIFHTSTGKPISQRNLLRDFRNTCDKIKLPKIRFHDLRHTCATLLLQADVHPKKVQELLGHSTIMLTMDTYSHIMPGMHDEAAEKMDDIFNA